MAAGLVAVIATAIAVVAMSSLRATAPVGAAAAPGADTPPAKPAEPDPPRSAGPLAPGVAAATAAQNLAALLTQEWDHRMANHPTWASTLGDRRYNRAWRDLSPQAIAADRAAQRSFLDRARAIARDDLPDDQRLTLDLFTRDLASRVAAHRFEQDLIPLDQRGGLQTDDELADVLRFETMADYDDWLARLRTFPVLVGQTLALMRRGIQTGVVPPRVVMSRLPDQLDKHLVDDPADSPFYKPFTRFAPAIPQADRLRLVAAARQAIAEGVIPAFREFQAFFVEHYLPACRDTVGLCHTPHGADHYAWAVRHYTTTDLSADDIHSLGLAEVARIRQRLLAIMADVKFDGDFAAFVKYLRSDPKFYYRTPDELLAAYRAMTRRIDPQLVRVFSRLPRMPYGVEAISPKIAPHTTTAYYQPPAADGSRAGTYYVNLYQPNTRPIYEMMALSLHEAVPGHHLQIALAMELGDLPAFRRYAGYTAFVEGWALYAESLGEEMGLYDDPYAEFGRLTYEMWRAVRLVVDTGLHARGWSRQQAIDYFSANAAKSEADIVNEIDRYISWPGQALAYKIGELRLWQLRRRAVLKLGAAFDLRVFHDVILRDGAVPLDVLEERFNRWLDAQPAS